MVVDIVTVASVLLVAHIASSIFVSIVLLRQYRLLRLPIKNIGSFSEEQRREITNFRIVLFTISIIILIGNFVPILIDAVTILSNNTLTTRTPVVRPISLVYAISNAATLFVSAYLIWRLYKLADVRKMPKE